jgi:uncharacterized membrane protein required for colicin V production
VTNLDWVIAAIVALSALGGWRRGLIRTVFWLVGLIVGAVVGARVAPHFLSAGTHSHYTAAIGLAGAFAGVVVCQLLAALAAKLIRGGLHLLPPLRLLDSLGGLAVGAVWGLALCWVVGAVALQVPGHPKVRREVRQSEVLHRLDQVAPPHDILKVQKQLASFASRLQSEATSHK